ncbi:hypothetical protein DICVIV_07552 [Dictyocaulus viviparus]|uniref:Uncharacterized protein n=1 Tax=Dictyocaulus viviparus TaxID=29172 RepID=A0A0D8XRM4_DICVI|nr:hypothetical protein DICVIV_07552 [Dictyocaulus viviparus]
MGEDAQLETSDEEYLLLPAVDETLKPDDSHDRWICSIDGSYAIDREKLRYGQEEILPWSGNSPRQRLVNTADLRKCSFSGVVLDDSLPVLSNSLRKLQVFANENKSSSSSHYLEADEKLEHSHTKLLRDHQEEHGKVLENLSPIQCADREHGFKEITSKAQIYDPLQRIVSFSSIANEDGFRSELQAQGDKLMNGLEIILRERLFRASSHRPLSSCTNTASMTLSRAGSVSTVSTGRDHLSKEVKRLENAFAVIDLDFGTDISHVARGSSSKKSYTTCNAFGLPDVLGKDGPESGSHGTSTVEQARQGSRCSVHVLTENAIRDAENSSRALKGLTRVPPQEFSTKVLKEQSTNTDRAPVRRLVVTHRVKHDAGFCAGNNQESEMCASKPSYHKFQLKSTVGNTEQVLDVDSIPHLSKHLHTRETQLDSGTERPIINGSGVDNGIGNLYKRLGGGKRGRPIVIGRTLYGRSRGHFRPMHRHNQSTKQKQATKIPYEKRGPLAVQDVSTSTDQKEIGIAEEANLQSHVENDNDCNELKYSPPIKLKPKSARHQRMPFVGSGLECSNTFSVAGNQQQVMKIVSIRFQEWLPIVRSIIYDSQCKDYAHALMRDLCRHKRANLEQIQILERDLKSCKDDIERHDINSDISRLRQQWSRKHDQVLKSLSEHVSRGGVHSKVQQLRTIYVACAS